MKIQLMKRMATATCFLALAGAMGTSLHAQDQQTPPDNSGRNKAQSSTADNQTNAKADREMTAKIRHAIVADKALSTYAHNIKIITVNGAVILKGPVKSDEEKHKVATDAEGAASGASITNQLTIK
jgi:hyperosmotically inducible protein